MSQYDTSGWHPDLQRAAAEYGAGHVITAFKVKSKIEQEGYRGIGFMSKSDTYLKQQGTRWVKNEIERNLKRNLEGEAIMARRG